jgi:hypothetical protein
MMTIEEVRKLVMGWTGDPGRLHIKLAEGLREDPVAPETPAATSESKPKRKREKKAD